LFPVNIGAAPPETALLARDKGAVKWHNDSGATFVLERLDVSTDGQRARRQSRDAGARAVVAIR
jgi:hypothetical protein